MQSPPRLLLLFPLLVFAACAGMGGSQVDRVGAIQAPPELPDGSRLDVGIRVFETGIPESEEDLPERVYPGIRSAEAYYFPCLLRITLQRTQQWGDVFLVPRESTGIELTLSAEIVESDGNRLVLDVLARDASQLVWLEKRYDLETEETDYYVPIKVDPYQHLFDTIANDLVAARARLSSDHLRTARNVAALRFAEEFAPDAFDGYLEPDEDGVLRPVRLPARNDPMHERIMQARASEAMFVDTLNGHYEGLCSGMTESYLNWRDHSRNEAVLYRKARRRRTAAIVAIPIVIGVVVAGAASGVGTAGVPELLGALGGVAVAQLFSKAREYGAEADLHRATLEELDASFATEVEPMVVETEGATHRITGSVDEQYEEWRRLLKELYLAEAGVVGELNAYIERPVEVADEIADEVAGEAADEAAERVREGSDGSSQATVVDGLAAEAEPEEETLQ
jgi:hypothetical protein